MKNILILIAFVLTLAGGYSLGYTHAAIDAITLMSTTQAGTSLVTIGFLEKNNLDMAKQVNSELIEANLKALDEVEKTKGEIWKFPVTYLDLRETYGENETLLEEGRSKIRKKFQLYRAKTRDMPNHPLERDGQHVSAFR